MFHYVCYFYRVENDYDDDEGEELVLNVKCHYSQAKILKNVFDLGDCASVKVSFGFNIISK